MPLALATVTSRQAVLATAEEYILQEIAVDRRVTLIVPSRHWQLDRKLMAARRFPAGVDITVPERFFDELWQLYGDGRTMVPAALRRGLLAVAGRITGDSSEAARRFPRVQGELTPSFQEELETLLDRAAFLPGFEAALRQPQDQPQELSASEREVMSLYNRYFHELKQRGLVDRSEAEYLLSGMARLAGMLVLEGFESLTPRQALVIRRLAQRNEVRFVVEYDATHPGRRATRALIELVEDGAENRSEGRTPPMPSETPAVSMFCAASASVPSAASVVPGVLGLWETVAPTALPSNVVASTAHPEELRQLIDRLYTNTPGIEPKGTVWAGECRGVGAEAAVVASLIQQALEIYPPQDIVLVLKDPASASPLITRELVTRDIPFILEYTISFVQATLGAALMSLFELFTSYHVDAGDNDGGASYGGCASSGSLGGSLDFISPVDPDEAVASDPFTVAKDEADFARLSALLSSPYAGLSRWAAWDCQRLWRERRGSTPRTRLEDAATLLGSSPLLSLARQVATQPMGEQWVILLLELLNLMLQNAASSGRRTKLGLAEDRSAARAVLDFAEKAAPFGGLCRSRDLSAIRVSMVQQHVCERPGGMSDDKSGDGQNSDDQSGDDGKGCVNSGGSNAGSSGNSNASSSGDDTLTGDNSGCDRGGFVSITSSSRMGLKTFPVVIMGDLDADSYPMSGRSSPLDTLALKFDVAPARDLAHHQRSLLLHLIEAASARFFFYRVTHDLSGEVRQSALWDELLANYHPFDNEAITTEPEKIPVALEPFTVRRYEAVEFWQSFQTTAEEPVFTVDRGKLSLSASRDHLFEQPLSVTALEAYVRCPYHWFIERRVNPTSIDGEFKAAFKGSFAHEVLNDFYRIFLEEGHVRVNAGNLLEAQALLGRCFAQTLAKKAQEGAIGNETEAREMQLIKRALIDYLARDATLLPGYAPRYLERTIDPLPYADALVRGRVDRLDVNAEGQAVIIDYKLSSTLKGYGIEARRLRIPHHIQGAIYATLVERALGVRVMGTLYRSIMKPRTRGVFASSLVDVEDRLTRVQQGYNKNDALPWVRASQKDTADSMGEPSESAILDFPSYLARVEDLSFEAIERFKAGDIRPRPRDKDICIYCSANSSCPMVRSHP
jgi:CRISPR/Cas system-associated exonuclease Cas4 (RecB family)